MIRIFCNNTGTFKEFEEGISLGDLAGPCLFAAAMGLSRVIYGKFGPRMNLRRVMMGRYGQDHLNVFLLIIAILLSLIASLIRLGFLSLLSYAVLLICFFRMLSRNITARRRENDRFLRLSPPGPYLQWPARYDRCHHQMDGCSRR